MSAVVNSAAALKRLPPGTMLTVTWPATGRTANRVFHAGRSADVVFLTDAGEKSYLDLRGCRVTATPDGFNVSWPDDPHATGCEYRFSGVRP